jgi:transposase
MLTWGEDVQAHALREAGWSISAIARHLGRDRKTIAAYLKGERIPGRRKPPGPDVFADYELFVRARFADDPHVPSIDLFDEVVELGYPRSYPTFTRQLRVRGLRPRCVTCQGVSARATIDIDHPPGDETQWDWVELPGAPWLAEGRNANLLVGTLPFSGRARGVFADTQEQPQLIEAIGKIVERLGGVSRAWRFDRMSTVVRIGTEEVLPSFAQVAKHYAVQVRLCPPYRANRKGSVEKGIDFLTQRWWRTAAVQTPAQAQASVDAFLSGIGDGRVRHRDGQRTTVGALAEVEPLRAAPAKPFPAVVRRSVTVARDATVAFEGNRYGVLPSLIGKPVVVRHRLGSDMVEVATEAGLVVAAHPRAVPGGHVIVRSDTQRAALEHAVLTAAAGQAGRPCHRKANRPPGQAAQVEAERLRRRLGGVDEDVVIDLSPYTRLVDGDDVGGVR